MGKFLTVGGKLQFFVEISKFLNFECVSSLNDFKNPKKDLNFLFNGVMKGKILFNFEIYTMGKSFNVGRIFQLMDEFHEFQRC